MGRALGETGSSTANSTPSPLCTRKWLRSLEVSWGFRVPEKWGQSVRGRQEVHGESQRDGEPGTEVADVEEWNEEGEVVGAEEVKVVAEETAADQMQRRPTQLQPSDAPQPADAW